jgi:hypothetical protein
MANTGAWVNVPKLRLLSLVKRVLPSTGLLYRWLPRVAVGR